LPFAFAVALALTPVFAVASAAQTGGPPNALQGFSKNRKEPIRIVSDSLEVRDKDKVATFIDNVRVTQGDTTLECKKLVVFYDGDSGARPAATRRTASLSPSGGGQSIRRLEAHGGVVVTQRDQTAVGDKAIYDTKSNSIMLLGSVVVTQGKNVISGEKLWVDLETGVSRVESPAGQGGRVEAVFMPGSETPAPPSAAAPQRPAAAPSPPPRPHATGSERRRNRPPSADPFKLN
jgi:lipopolysaccharide export system protein LptA